MKVGDLVVWNDSYRPGLGLVTDKAGEDIKVQWIKPGSVRASWIRCVWMKVLNESR